MRPPGPRRHHHHLVRVPSRRTEYDEVPVDGCASERPVGLPKHRFPVWAETKDEPLLLQLLLQLDHLGDTPGRAPAVPARRTCGRGCSPADVLVRGGSSRCLFGLFYSRSFEHGSLQSRSLTLSGARGRGFPRRGDGNHWRFRWLRRLSGDVRLTSDNGCSFRLALGSPVRNPNQRQLAQSSRLRTWWPPPNLRDLRPPKQQLAFGPSATGSEDADFSRNVS